jgi:hypothetical protein
MTAPIIAVTTPIAQYPNVTIIVRGDETDVEPVWDIVPAELEVGG